MKHTILFLAANPLGTDRLALDREAREIQRELESSGFRDRFELVTRWAVEPLDLLRELRKLKPSIVHFSGHGAVASEVHRDAPVAHRDVAKPSGAVVNDRDPPYHLVFQGPDGQAQFVSTVALAQTFGAAGRSVRLVVLNACYSEAQAAALLPHVDCVVGMSGRVDDDAARAFAVGFYGGLGERASIAGAYAQGDAAVSLMNLRKHAHPRLAVREGVDAGMLVLGASEAALRLAARDAEIELSRAELVKEWQRRSTPPEATPTPPEPRDELLTRLTRLLPAQFEMVLFRAKVPTEYLSGASAPQATRAIDVVRYLEPRGQLNHLARILDEVA